MKKYKSQLTNQVRVRIIRTWGQRHIQQNTRDIIKDVFIHTCIPLDFQEFFIHFLCWRFFSICYQIEYCGVLVFHSTVFCFDFSNFTGNWLLQLLKFLDTYTEIVSVFQLLDVLSSLRDRKEKQLHVGFLSYFISLFIDLVVSNVCVLKRLRYCIEQYFFKLSQGIQKIKQMYKSRNYKEF